MESAQAANQTCRLSTHVTFMRLSTKLPKVLLCCFLLSDWYWPKIKIRKLPEVTWCASPLANPLKSPSPSLTYKRSFNLRMKRRLPLSNRCHSMYKSRRVTSRCVFLRQRFCSTLLQCEVLISGAAEWPNQLGIFFIFLWWFFFLLFSSLAV